ncbi:MAG TPA: dual specificity protein phosphatase family protein [Planctomycetota bacterium]|jgi:atypical dual specificity phosphatase|nr:dual specificity protein phosphatase family protein [Planctomycetota bacterium]
MQKPLNFAFVLPDRLAGMAHPDRFSRLEDQLDYLQANHISAVLSVCMSGLDKEKLKAHNFIYLHEPIPDFAAPPLARLSQLVNWVDQQIQAGRGVVVHCGAGFGRTGTILTAYFLTKDPSLSAYQALNQVRKLRPGSVESLEQEITLYNYARVLKRPLGPLTQRLRQHSDLELLEYGLAPDCYLPSQDFRE